MVKNMHKKRIRKKLAKRFKKEAIENKVFWKRIEMMSYSSKALSEIKLMQSKGATKLDIAIKSLESVNTLKRIWDEVLEAKRIDDDVYYRDKMGGIMVMINIY